MTRSLAPRLGLSLPTEWTVHEPEEWKRLGDLSQVNPALRAVETSMINHTDRPHMMASLRHAIHDDSDDSITVVMASLVIFVVGLEDGVHSAELEGHVRRKVKLVDDIQADFFELPIFIADKSVGMGALATFTTPNLPLLDDMVPGFRKIAETIKFVVGEE